MCSLSAYWWSDQFIGLNDLSCPFSCASFSCLPVFAICTRGRTNLDLHSEELECRRTPCCKNKCTNETNPKSLSEEGLFTKMFIHHNLPMIPIVTAITTDHWCTVINSTTCWTNPNLILFIRLSKNVDNAAFTSKMHTFARFSLTCSSMVCNTFIWGSKIADWWSNFLSASLAKLTLDLEDFDLEPFKLLEPFGLPRPDGVDGSGVEVVIDEWYSLRDVSK